MKKIFLFFLFITIMFGWVGEISAIKGKAVIKRGDMKLVVIKGERIEKNDIIETFSNSKLQIIFKDKTIITLGKNSKFKVADYLFDDENAKAEFSLSRGVMKTLTGKIGKIAPKRFRVITKNASIGIRGTYFIVEKGDKIVTLSMLSGVTIFTNLKNMESYEVKVGEQLIFDVEKNSIRIKHYIPLKELKTKDDKSSEADEVMNDENRNSKDVTKDTIKKDNLYMKFVNGVKKLWH